MGPHPNASLCNAQSKRRATATPTPGSMAHLASPQPTTTSAQTAKFSAGTTALSPTASTTVGQPKRPLTSRRWRARSTGNGALHISYKSRDSCLWVRAGRRHLNLDYDKGLAKIDTNTTQAGEGSSSAAAAADETPLAWFDEYEFPVNVTDKDAEKGVSINAQRI